MIVLMHFDELKPMINVCGVRHFMLSLISLPFTDHVMMVHSFVIQRFAPPLPGDSDWELCHDPPGPCHRKLSVELVEFQLQQAVPITVES
jgi:hypothetical protein